MLIFLMILKITALWLFLSILAAFAFCVYRARCWKLPAPDRNSLGRKVLLRLENADMRRKQLEREGTVA